MGRVENVEILAIELRCGVGSLPTTFLDLALHRLVGVWDSIEERFREMMPSLKRQHISKGGKLTLIRHTLSSLPICFLSLF